jgi:hypothetical protein
VYSDLEIQILMDLRESIAKEPFLIFGSMFNGNLNACAIGSLIPHCRRFN